MTEQELHEKIINIIKENGVYNGKSMHRDYYVVNDEELADVQKYKYYGCFGLSRRGLVM
jgi:hypothetical protein